jgi:hypothetical protein
MATHTINITEINGMYATTIRTTEEDGTVTIERMRLSPEDMDQVLNLLKSLK